MEKNVESHDGFIIIRHQSPRIAVPIACPVCEFILIDQIDEKSIQRSSCCFDCENEVADTNRPRWNAGWRPTGAALRKIKDRRVKSFHGRHN
jgi:hypothetical protein